VILIHDFWHPHQLTFGTSLARKEHGHLFPTSSQEQMTMTVEQILQLFVAPHLIGGTAALALFWLAAVLKKGSQLHRRVGQVYLLAMMIILSTAVPLIALTWMRGNIVTAVFLTYLTMLIALSCRNALAAVRFRRDPARFFGRNLQVLATVVGLTGVAVVILGLTRQAWILVGFGLIGPILLKQSAKAIKAQRQGISLDPKWWLKEHYGAMVANGAATHIAFFQIGLSRLLPNLDLGVIQNLAWFGPLAVSILAAAWLNRRYGMRRVGSVEGATG
jgi:hypothetical protein